MLVWNSLYPSEAYLTSAFQRLSRKRELLLPQTRVQQRKTVVQYPILGGGGGVLNKLNGYCDLLIILLVLTISVPGILCQGLLILNTLSTIDIIYFQVGWLRLRRGQVAVLVHHSCIF